MKSKKPDKPTKRDKARQQKIEKKVASEKVVLAHPKGKERFEQVMQALLKKQ